MRDRLTNTHVLENWIAQVESDIPQACARAAHDFKIWFLFEREFHVGCKRVGFHVGAALAQFERARGGVRDNRKAHALELCLYSPIVTIALDHHISILLGAHKLKRS